MTRIAHCCCGSLRVEATGEPWLVGVCHCTECQRRTGSAFSVGTYFPKVQVRTEGPSKVYVRGSDSGRKVEIHFCPDCGTSMFWYAELRPNDIGIALGTFADPLMPWPTLSVWETTRHPWVAFDHPVDRFTGGLDRRGDFTLLNLLVETIGADRYPDPSPTGRKARSGGRLGFR